MAGAAQAAGSAVVVVVCGLKGMDLRRIDRGFGGDMHSSFVLFPYVIMSIIGLSIIKSLFQEGNAWHGLGSLPRGLVG